MNTLLILFIVGALAAVVWKLIDQRVDDKQEDYQVIADAFSRIGQDTLADYWKARARGAFERALSIALAIKDRLMKPGGVEEVMATMMVKSLKDKDFIDHEQYKTRVRPVLVELALGAAFDDKMKAEVVTLAPVLREYGSTYISELLVHLVSGNVEAARAAGHQLFAMLRNTEQLDDELVKRAAKTLPRIVREDPRHWDTLNKVLQACKPTNGAVIE